MGQMQAEWWRAERITQLGFVAVLCCVLVLSVLSYSGIEQLEANIQEIARNYNQRNILTQSLSRVVNHRMMLARDIVSVDDAFARDRMVQEYSRLAGDFDRYFSRLMASDHEKDERALLERLVAMVRSSSGLQERIRELPNAPPNIDAKSLLHRAMSLSGEVHGLLDQLQIQQRQDFEAALERAKLYHTRNLQILLMSFILILGIMLYIAYRVSGYVKRSNRQLTTMAMEKSMLLATMSHEIRTPLTSIIGFGETLLETDTTKEERISGIHAIVRNGRYLQGVINDVLDYSKLDAGKMELQTETMSIATCLDDMDSMLRGRAQSKGLNFNIDALSPLPEHLVTDPIKLRQILINLLGNAIKFTEVGEVRLEVGFDEPKNILCFDVIDTGAGIDSEQLQRLFNPYRQVGPGRQEGTGLGLYISRQMAELLGGELTVSSEPGRGSCFRLSLPVGDVGAEKRIQWRRTEPEDSPGAFPRTTQFSGRVLLAEDRRDNQKLFSIYLNKAGLDVDIVEDGIQAVQAALESDYSIVLMDMQMPNMDGVTAVRELRRHGYPVPIIALTANQSAENRQRCKEAGFDDFLTKPISRADFIQMLGRYLSVRPAEEEESMAPIFSEIFDQEPDLQPAVDYFVGQLPTLQRQLGEVLEEREWGRLKELIHDLKGSAGGVGYPMLSQLAMKVEFALAKRDDEEAVYLSDRVLNQIQRIQQGYTLQREGGASPV
jgi:signal transduction histidine kinase/DNA-binding NarL/FixJ family response regulator